MKQHEATQNSVSVEINYGTTTNNFNTKQINRTEVLYDPDLYISDQQASEIRRMVTELVDMLASKNPENRAKLFGLIYGKLKNRFKARATASNL